jgi:pimeloyl-ACP methyl ester carboxylesterase
LHPDRTTLDNRGSTPEVRVGSITSKLEYTRRGWGEVGEASYHSFLLELEDLLNNHRTALRDPKRVGEQFLALMNARPAGGEREAPWNPEKEFAAPTSQEINRMDDWLMPVYACGYNWLQDNGLAATRLATRIREIISENHDGKFRFCEQVIVITHSMGGLVARACAQLAGMERLIAGVVHGVMPTNGAPVAYRRCKVGMKDEDSKAGIVIGNTGQHVTAVFSQAPGALQLLPTDRYAYGWLEIRGLDGKTLEEALPRWDPYEEIYSQRYHWWALIHEDWLAPEGGIPITWGDYLWFLEAAKTFHQSLAREDYHPKTYVFYGFDNVGKTASFERITWEISKPDHNPWPELKNAAPPVESVYHMTARQANLQGENPERVYGYRRNGVAWTQFLLQASAKDGMGDGTVPSSARVKRVVASVKLLKAGYRCSSGVR